MVLVFKMEKDFENRELLGRVLDFLYEKIDEDVNVGPFKDSLLEEEGVWIEHEDVSVLDNIREKVTKHLNKWNPNFTSHFEDV